MINKKLLCVAILGGSVLSSSALLAQSMPEAILSSIEDNPELSVVFNQYRARQSATRVAKGGYLPSIDLSAGYGNENSDSPSTRAANNDHDRSLTRGELSLTLRQLLFDGFGTSNDVDRTTAEEQAHRYQLQATAEDLALNVARVYLDVLLAEQTRVLSEQNLASHKQIYQQIDQRTAQGIGSTSDLSQAEGRLARAQSNRVAAENNLYDAQSKFLRLVGKSPAKLQQPQAPLDKLPATLALAQQQALEAHPRLIGAQFDLDATGYKIGQLRSRYSPQVFFELGSSWNDNIDGVNGHNNDTTAMIRLNYNLFAGGKDKYQIREAASQRDEAADILRNANRQVVEGLALSWNAYQALGQQQTFLQRHTSASEATLVAYRQQFDLGRRTLMDLLDTENERFEAEKSLLQSQRDHRFSQYRILNSTGSLLSALAIALPES